MLGQGINEICKVNVMKWLMETKRRVKKKKKTKENLYNEKTRINFRESAITYFQY